MMIGAGLITYLNNKAMVEFIEKSVKDPKNHPDNVILDVKKTLKNNNLQ